MNRSSYFSRKSRIRRLANILLFCAVGVAVNVFFARLAIRLELPLFLDCIGTMLSAALGGYLPGVLVGYLTNLINGLSDADTLYYGVISILIAVLSTWFMHRGWFRKPGKICLAVLCFALIGGGLGSVLTWLLYGYDFGTGISAPLAHRICESTSFGVFLSQLSADLIIDIADKAVTVLAVLLIMRLIPGRFMDRFDFSFWHQRPLSREEKRAAKRSRVRSFSLRSKILILASVGMLILAAVTLGISVTLYHQSSIDSEAKMGCGVANVVLQMLDADRTEEYMTGGDAAEGYQDIEKAMTELRNSSDDIEYIYVYQIREDGCHVVFDPDTEDTPGADPGEVVPFDDAFLDKVPALLSGERIDPVISNESYGWLLSIYQPVYDSSGECACYIGVDISMKELLNEEVSFVAKVSSLFSGFLILILVIGLWLSEYSILMPLNTMAIASSSFAFNSEASRSDGLKSMEQLDIHTGDELENLYLALCKTSGDMMQYIQDVQEKNETISKMQNNLILVLADMVESRDQFTGDHVRKTSAYAEIIMNELKKEGIYTELLTDRFMEDVIHSAPLHDVGKIKISDSILNKPGRLTAEEFQKMKSHTLAGREIISDAVDAMSESSYLEEAQNLAAYHHEKWDGSGYPYGLSGEDIPLSARIMAVADVFDALVSKRSYKEPFPVEKALSIIKEGSGSHFDPKIASAFLNAEAEVRRIAAMHSSSFEKRTEI